MTRTMYDSTNVNDLPANGDLYAGYVAGSYKNYDQVKARFPNKPVVSITPKRFDANSQWIVADVLDIETGNSQPSQGPSWVEAMRQRGRTPTIYCPASLWSTCRQAFTSAGVPEPLWWIAKYDNKPVMIPGAVAKQYGGNVAGHYDVSIVADYWPGVDTPNNYVGDDLLMSAAKNDDDARRCLIRQWFDTYLGRAFSNADEQNLHLLNFINVGADLELAGIMDSPEAKAYRSRTADTR